MNRCDVSVVVHGSRNRQVAVTVGGYRGKSDIGRLEVTINNIPRMDVFQGVCDLTAHC